MHLEFLGDLVAVFAIGGLVVYALSAFKLPAIVGLLLAGAAVGPHGASLVSDTRHVEVLAEIGVVLLLFTVGLEFSLAQLFKMYKLLLGVGGAQVVLTILAMTGLASLVIDSWQQAMFFGFLAALSSTAIVLRLLGEKAQLVTPAGRIVLSVLLFQDLCIVPLMLLVPFLAGHGSGALDLGLTMLKAAAVIVGVVLVAQRLVPALLRRVVGTRSRELFLTLVLVLCLGMAWATSLVGLSLALGAFLAGLSISESEYSHQALAEAIPFRDAFGSLFFLSIGMLLDVGFVVQNPGTVVLAVLLVIALKTVMAALPILLFGYPAQIALRAGLTLAQVGEFAFVLSTVGLSYKLIGGFEYQTFLAASVISMMLTPAMMSLGAKLVERLPATALLPPGLAELVQASVGEELERHVVIVGYGLNGQNLARALGSAEIPYCILEMNPETVRAARGRGEPISYGDCTRAPVLESVGVQRATMLVIAISDAPSSRQAVSLARSLNPELYILVRTRFVNEISELAKLGANEVVPEEFETSIEIFARVLHQFKVPGNVIQREVRLARSGLYEMLREPGRDKSHSVRLDALEHVKMELISLPDNSPGCNATLSELGVRQQFGVSVLAVYRGESAIANPGPDQQLQSGDTLMVLGDDDAVTRATLFFDPGTDTA